MNRLILFLSLLCCMRVSSAHNDAPMPNVQRRDIVFPVIGKVDMVFNHSHQQTSQAVPTFIALNDTLRIDKRWYYIITTPPCLESAKRFAKWKRTKGYNVLVHSVHYSNGQWATREQKESELLGIISMFNNTVDSLCYVLIVGDDDALPGHWCHYEIGLNCFGLPNVYEFPSDYYYECLGDPEHETPKFYVGRIPESSDEEANAVFDKIIAYEKHPTAEADFYETAVSCAVFDGGVPMSFGCREEDGRAIYTSENIVHYLEDSIADSKNVKRIYLNVLNHEPYDSWYYNQSLTPGGFLPSYLHDYNMWQGNYQNITDSINAGTFLFSYIGHGDVTTWENAEEDQPDNVILYSEAYSNELTNQDKYPVVLSMSCHTGEYQHAGNSLAEYLLKKPNAGAVAVIAPASTALVGYSEHMDEGFINAMWPSPGINNLYNLDTATYELGDALAQGKKWMGHMKTYNAITHQPDSLLAANTDFFNFSCNSFHLFGDPSMQLYTDTPQCFTEATFERTRDAFIVHTHEENTRVTFYEPYNDDEDENVTSYIGSDVVHHYNWEFVDSVSICIDKHNFVPAVLTYMVGQKIQNKTISDRRTYIGFYIDVGKSVTNLEPHGDVVFTSGADVTIEGEEITLQPGTRIERGARLRINQGLIHF